MKRICTICARAGSKGVKNKNLIPLRGIPLLGWTVMQAKKSGCFDLIAMSSDSKEILEAALRFGADVAVERPLEFATDQADKSPAIQHCALDAERQSGMRFDTFVDLDVTAPLRRIADIRGAVELLESTGAENVFSAVPSRRSPYFNMVEVDLGNIPRLCKTTNPPPVRRQDVPNTYDLNASIYVWNRQALLEKGAGVLLETTRVYVMAEETIFDLDSPVDLKIIELFADDYLREVNT
jgi:CMP-N,N'-diacetyllegionaminic acid synthase